MYSFKYKHIKKVKVKEYSRNSPRILLCAWDCSRFDVSVESCVFISTIISNQIAIFIFCSKKNKFEPLPYPIESISNI